MVAIVFNTYFLCQLLVCWPFKNYDDNLLMTTAMSATSITLFGALIVQGQIAILDEYCTTDDLEATAYVQSKKYGNCGATTGLLMGTTGALFVLYLAMLIRFQLPFVCNWFMPECISKSALNCFKPPPKPPPKPEAAPPPEEKAKEEASSFDVLPPPPPPVPTQEMETEMLDKLIDEYFHRYDLDESGTLNSNEELKQLATNLSFKLRLTLTGDEIDAIVEAAGNLSDENEWTVDEFGEWYKDNFLGIFDDSGLELQGDMAMAIGMAQNADMNRDLAAAAKESDDDADDAGD